MITILQDLRLAGARLRARPGHFAIVGLILALGIGASTAIFTLVDATLFRPFDLPEGDRLVRIDAVNSPSERSDPKNHSNSSYPTYTDYRDETSIFSGVAAFTNSVALHVGEGDGRALRVTGAPWGRPLVTDSFVYDGATAIVPYMMRHVGGMDGVLYAFPLR